MVVIETLFTTPRIGATSTVRANWSAESFNFCRNAAKSAWVLE